MGGPHLLLLSYVPVTTKVEAVDHELKVHHRLEGVTSLIARIAIPYEEDMISAM